MNYIQVELFIEGEDITETGEILIALLSEYPFDSFDENETGIRAFMPVNLFNRVEITGVLNDLKTSMNFSYEITEIEDQNWNKKWESNYDPVLIDGKCYIRAPFHEAKKDVDYEIVIEPKMSFGTAHHETTSMMISYILENNFEKLTVLDMGCGTAVLAILASMKGATSLVAIDNDEWAYTNTLENLERNNITNTLALQGGKEAIPDQKFEVILANINRNILLDQIQIYSRVLSPGGKLFMSGFYEEDIPVIAKEAEKFGLKLINNKMKNNWVAVEMERIEVRG
ncbi:MAG: 50S ribosomal protein L11 methyltransferase [Bacteroidales bacterium]|nr:50S ribosomal protein L11 methyltransferase [Bacteroidales bacterium]